MMAMREMHEPPAFQTKRTTHPQLQKETHAKTSSPTSTKLENGLDVAFVVPPL